MLIVAHRTCPLQAPENSLAGLVEAARQGAGAVEIDLRVSLDQQPFLMHDNTMGRTTGWPLPLELTPAVTAGSRRLENGEALPSLRAALDALPPGLRLAVDVKTPWAIFPLVREIRRRSLQERVLVWCESALAARYAAASLPGSEVAYLKSVQDAADKRAFLARARSMGCRAVSAHWLAIDAAFVADAHALRLRVYSFHERYELEAAKLSSGLDGLITDFVAEALAATGGDALY